MSVWHVYGHSVPKGDLAGCWATITVELTKPQEMLYEFQGMPYLTSFGHEPSDEEMEIVRQTFEVMVNDDKV